MTRWQSFKRGVDDLLIKALVAFIVLGAVIQGIEQIRKAAP